MSTFRRPVGIVDVARRAGVSPATVSRAFNLPDLVTPATRTKIAAAARDLGYIRDRMAGSLQNRFTGTIGLVVPTIDNAIFAELIDSFAGGLRAHDRTMLIAAHGYDLGLEAAIIRSLIERRIDGVALIGFDHDTASLRLLADRSVPMLAVWNHRADGALPSVGADNVEAGAMVTNHLLDLGHRDIALMFPLTDRNDRARDRLAGVRAAMDTRRLTPDPARRLMAPYDIGRAKEAALGLLARDRPTAVLCGNDVIAHGVLYACQAMGLAVPGEVSIAGIGDFRGSAHMEPGLTTVRLPARAIGKASADTLVRMITDRTPPANWARQVPVTFVERASTARPAR